MPILLAETNHGGWSPGVGDPTLLGWLTVFAYLTATLLCVRTAVARQTSRTDRVFWWIFASGLILLGINKQLDLQTYFVQVGGRLAKRQGWYTNRRFYQVGFVMVVALAGLIVVAFLSWNLPKQRRFPLVGMALLLTFIVLRAAFFTHVDNLLGTTSDLMKWIWVLEIGGIAVIGWGAWKAYALPPGRPDSAMGHLVVKIGR